MWSYCRYRHGIALCGRNFSYLHPPTIDEISKPIHLSDHKPLKLCTVGIDAFLAASGRSITTTSSLLPPLPELFVL